MTAVQNDATSGRPDGDGESALEQPIATAAHPTTSQFRFRTSAPPFCGRLYNRPLAAR